MRSRPTITYPFVPRSTAFLLAGQFWALPLSDGSCGCGRVIELRQKEDIGSRVLFLGGVLDWHGNAPPTSDTIAGASCLDQGKVNLKAITTTGGLILGHRPLELDGIEPWEFRGAAFHVNSFVFKGLQRIRPQTRADSRLPVLDTWGFNVPLVIAENRYVRRSSR